MQRHRSSKKGLVASPESAVMLASRFYWNLADKNAYGIVYSTLSTARVAKAKLSDAKAVGANG